MKLISWNLNGLNSCVQAGSFGPILARGPDLVFCQEIRTKARPEVLPGYLHYWNPAQRNGYSGTLAMARRKPQRVLYGMGDERLDAEGRILALEYPAFVAVGCYVPNSQRNLQRLRYRLDWDEAFLDFVTGLTKPAILCGDFNVARLDIDVYAQNERQVRANAGYESDERSGLNALLDAGFADAFRALYPDRTGEYTWWSNRLAKRMENRGWRLDYFLVHRSLLRRVREVRHLRDIYGSDHCPIELEVRL